MTENASIRILIVDDHAVVREGLSSYIALEPDIVVVGEAADGDEALEKVPALNPDIILLDLVMPRKSGLEVMEGLADLNHPAKVLVLTSFTEHDHIFLAIKSGAKGIMLKDSSPAQLIRAIRNVYQGQISLHPLIAEKLVQEINQESELPPTESPLTERELEVLTLVAKGMRNQEIAERLSISERTVGSHVGHILDKLHLANRTQAALFALREGITTLDQE
jgi:NarL family two-component system response regulator LiaR